MKKQEDRTIHVLGKNVAARRKAAGFKSADLFAEKAGVSISGLRDIERGVSEGRIETRVSIADFLKCTVSDLYKDPDSSPTKLELLSAADLLTKFSGAPPDIQKLVLSIVSNNVSHLQTASKDFRLKAISFLKGILAL